MERILEDNWDQHWSDFGEASMQGPASKYRTRLVLQLLAIERVTGPVQMLDLGSGMGDFAAEFHERFPEAGYTGIELSSTAIGIASQRVPSARFLRRDLLSPGPAEQTPARTATHAVCSEVLEHLDSPDEFLRNASRYMAPGCRLIVTVPSGPMNEFDKHIGHRRHYQRDTLAAVLEQSGFVVERMFAAGFPFFNLYRILLAMRGSNLIGDLSRPGSCAPWHVRAGMVLFGWLFRFNWMCWGWQMIAIARWPG